MFTWWKSASGLGRAAVVVVLLCAVGLGGAVVRLFAPRVETKTVTDTTTISQLQEQLTETKQLNATLLDRLSVVVNQGPRVITVTDTRPACDGGTPETIVTRETDAPVTTTTTEEKSSTKAADTTTTATVKQDTTTHTLSTTTTNPLPRFSASVGAGLSPLRTANGTTLLGAFQVRPLEALPLQVGAWGTVPVLAPAGFTVGLSVGLQW